MLLLTSPMTLSKGLKLLKFPRCSQVHGSVSVFETWICSSIKWKGWARLSLRFFQSSTPMVLVKLNCSMDLLLVTSISHHLYITYLSAAFLSPKSQNSKTKSLFQKTACIQCKVLGKDTESRAQCESNLRE